MTRMRRKARPPKTPTLADWTRLASRRLRRIDSRWNIGVQMVGAATMKRLNRGYRGKHYATDVLSFPAPAPLRKLGDLGDLVICVPTMRRQARELGHDARVELDVLLVHGFLHLNGYDHEKGGAPARRMAQMERRLLKRLGRDGSTLIERARAGREAARRR